MLPYSISLWNIRCYFYGSCWKTLVCNCANMTSPMGCSSQIFVYRLLWRRHFNFLFYFIAVPIEKTLSMSSMRFNNGNFYLLFYFIAATLSKFSQSFNVRHWNRLLTNIINKEYTGFYTLKIVSGKTPKYQ